MWEMPGKGARVDVVDAYPVDNRSVRDTPDRYVQLSGPVVHGNPTKTWDWRPEGPPGRVRRPTGLFLEFAETPPTEGAICRFAGRYGLLGQHPFTADSPPTSPGEPAVISMLPRESVTTWTTEIGKMREVVDVWHEIKKNDTRGLEKRISWTPGGVFYNTPGLIDTLVREDGGPAVAAFCPGEIRAIARSGTKELSIFKAGEVLAPARVFLQTLINEKLAALGVNLQLIRRTPSPLSEFGLYHVPRCLLGAMWLQFAGAVCGGLTYRRCDAEGCGKWFEVAGGRDRSARADKRFCSPACKVRIHYRKRHPTKPR